MKRVLIISRYYLDLKDIASIRINGLTKFLPEFGWKPYILTSGSDSTGSFQSRINVFEAPYEDKRIKWKRMLHLNEDQSLNEQFHVRTKKDKKSFGNYILNIWEEIFCYPDSVTSWRKPAVELGRSIIERNLCDAMISSSGPPTCNLIANDLKEDYNLPWIADFRDLWTQNHYNQFSRFRRFFERRLEIEALSNADALTTVSEPLAEKLKDLHPSKNIFSIPNGFDPGQRNPGSPLEKRFTITYTGALYRGRRDPEPLFQALSSLISKGYLDPKDLSVDFYGHKEDWLEDDVKRYGLDGVVRINGSVSRDESVEVQRRSHLLLLLTWNNKEERGVYTGKLFDYLAAGRPILSVGMSGGVVEDLLKATGAGFQPKTVQDIEQIIMNAYNEYKSENTVAYNGISSEIDKYSHIEMARKFASVLDDLVETKN
jgi:glycosyltransferase involved in cell wall biosynthesis